MRFAVETWAPEYGAPVGGDVLGESDAERRRRRRGAGRPTGRRAPSRRRAAPLRAVRRRRAAHRRPACGSRATTAPAARACARAGRPGSSGATGGPGSWRPRCGAGVLCAGEGVEAIVTRHGDYRAYPVRGAASGDPLGQALGQVRGDLEGRVAVEAGRRRRARGRRRSARRPPPHRRGGRLRQDPPRGLPAARASRRSSGGWRPGERTPAVPHRRRAVPLLVVPAAPRAGHPRVVGRRAVRGVGRPARSPTAVARADRVTATLPRFASQPHNDPRAPQNLHPIAGLERELKRRLGDPLLLERALREAAAA